MELEFMLLTMCTLFLIVADVAMIILIFYIITKTSKERNDYINRILSKDSNEYLKLKNNGQQLIRETSVSNGVYFPGMENDVL